ncbi:DEKNAAC102574 [Brettanomyces naardenensis]|uniref:Peroxisomal hydratase-dehydrogenase-epimerase n=1 Tax=Brettanomyces naardenensis TaxID=13370 RepID=A0A448YKN3_BRENA|nr:DEKNAAC102574 [Brettanomyces naardenensis]
MTQDISFKDKVVIITGAGGGLGKQYALRFAERGAKVVVNDLGGSLSGSGNSTKAADVVVEEIKSKGGTAVSNYDNVVTNAEGILKTAVDNFGTVHVLINNAGILKDASFKKMTEKQFTDVLDVHLNGSFRLTKACWPYFKKQNYGRIIMTASPAGLYGNFGQANYSAAKLALVGFGETLAKEGYKNNIKVNAIAPLAKSRMTETIMPPDILERLLPQKISPLVLFLTSDQCPTTGSIYEVAAGLFAQIRWERSGGLYLRPDNTLTPEAILNRFKDISDFTKPGVQHPVQLNDYNQVWTVTSKLPSNDQGNTKIDSLKGKVVIITGAGAGLGRSHALLFAKYGAKVVVNDFKDPETVVNEIRSAGGTAIGSKHDVFSEAGQIVKTAIDNFGTVDVLVNNAGILRDRSFSKMTNSEWQQVIQIHLLGTFRMCKLVWPIFLEKGSGYIINTTSTSGIYGNFGQANYAAAKAGILALTRTLAIEGKKAHIICNAIAPHAETAMTRTIFKDSELNKFSPSQVSPTVVLLASEELGGVTGELYEVGAGWIGNTRWQRAKGAISHDKEIPVEFVRDNWTDVVDYSKSVTIRSAQESTMAILDSVGGGEEEDDDGEEEDEEDVEDEVDNSQSAEVYDYDHRRVILYNISIGATAKELKYVYESDENFQVIPSFGVIPFMNQEDGGLNFDNLLRNYSPLNLLHGEHYLKINKFPIPTAAEVTTKSFPIAVVDKSKGNKHNVLMRAGYETYDTKTKELLFTNVGSYFIRKCETKDGKSHAYRSEGSAFVTNSFDAPTERRPDLVATFKTDENLAVLYRLNGDFNPLHIDPSFAEGANFKKPILHGLCFFGISAKILLDNFGPFDEAKMRFTQAVYPGETIQVRAWKQGSTIIFQTLVLERNVVVIDKAAVRLLDHSKSKL